MRVSVKTLALQMLLAAAYVGAARASVAAGMVHDGLGAASAAASLGVVAGIFLGRRALIGVGLGCLVAGLSMSLAPSEATAVTVAALVEAGAATWLLRRAGFHPAMRRISDVIGFVVGGAVIPSIVSAAVGTLAIELTRRGHAVGPVLIWRDWMLALFSRTVTVGALMSVFAARGWSGLRSRETLHAAAAACLVGIFGMWLLDDRGSIPYPLLLAVFVLAAVYRQRGATLGTAALTAVTIAQTSADQGPFVSGAAGTGVVRAEAFVAVGALAALAIAAAFSERRRLQSTTTSLAESTRMLAEAQRVGEIGSFVLDLRTMRAVWSEQLYAIVGGTRDTETSWDHWRERLVPEDRERVDATTQELMLACGTGEFLSRIVREDGQLRWIETKISYERDGDGGPAVRARGTCQDVTSLKLAEERQRSLFEHAPYPIVVVDPRGVIVETNVLAQELLARTSEELLGSRIGEFLVEPGPRRSPDAPPAPAWFTGLSRDGIHPDVELWGVRADGERFPLEVFLTPLPTEDGTLTSIGFRDVTKLREAAEVLQFQARHDLLTGLPNRRMFLEHLNMALARARRSGRPLAVIFADLDNFKRVNDGQGHDVGDALLKALTPRMHAAIRHGDLVARLGGDEFVILCEDVDSDLSARRVAERVADVVSQPLVIGGCDVRVGLSAGVVVIKEPGGTDPEEVLRDADAAMYSAKARGKGQIVVFDTGTLGEVWGRAAAS